MLVEQREDCSLVNVDLNSIFLGEIICLDLKVTVTEEPMKLPATEFFGVELLEDLLDLTHNRWNFALRDFLIRPVTAGENLNRKIDSINNGSTSVLLEIIIEVLRFDHVLEHGFDLIDCVIAALNSKFIDHLFFSPIRQGGLVEESLG